MFVGGREARKKGKEMGIGLIDLGTTILKGSTNGLCIWRPLPAEELSVYSVTDAASLVGS